MLWNLPKLDKDIPLCAHSDQDKLIVCYDSNKIAVFDLLNFRMHEWSRRNLDKFPQNFLNRFNRIVGITPINATKFILYTNYTYIILDLTQDVPSDEVNIIQNHPGKSVEEKSLAAKSWFDNLKLSQSKYISGNSSEEYDLRVKSSSGNDEKVKNLTISNKIKGILYMEYDQTERKLRVIENVWKKLVEAFPGAVAIPKYGQ